MDEKRLRELADLAQADTVVEAKNEINYGNLVRYIPTGSKVITELRDKSLKLTIIQQVSAPPMTTKDIPNTEQRLLKDVAMFLKDVATAVKIKDTNQDKYVFIQGKENAIQLVHSFTISVANKQEGKKLVELDKALDFYKKSKIK